MHGEVDGAVLECQFEFLDEDSLVEYALLFGNIGQSDVGAAVTGGLDDAALELQLRKGALQSTFGDIGLIQRQIAAAGADSQSDWEGVAQNFWIVGYLDIKIFGALDAVFGSLTQYPISNI